MKNSAKRVVDSLSSWSTLPGALHERLTEAIKEAVRQGSLFPGMRLPAERHLAKLLAVSRTTVVTSYNDLRTSGWVESRVGSGTWISKKKAGLERASAHAAVVARSPLINMLQARETGAIDFATTGTIPMTECVLPLMKEIAAHAPEMLAERDYMPYGLLALREAVAKYYTASGTPTCSEEVLITTGAQQGLSLACTLLLQRGDHVLVENPTYYGALETLRVSGARIAAVEIGANHVSPKMLKQRIAAVSPRMVYLTPTAQNPTGHSMPDASRAEIARDTLQHGVTIVEDEVCAEMSFGAHRPRSICGFAPEANVLTIGSLSKLFWFGLRVGWVRGPRALIGRLARLKTALDLGSSMLPQSLAVDLLSSVPEGRRRRRSELMRKAALVRALMQKHLPEYPVPEVKGGLSYWVRMPGIDTRLLAQTALRHGVILSHGNMFSVDESHAEYLRVPFVLEDELLEAGIQRLANAVEEISGSRQMKQEFSMAVT